MAGILIVVFVALLIIYWALHRVIKSRRGADATIMKPAAAPTKPRIIKEDAPERDTSGYPTKEYLDNLLRFGVTWEEIDQRYEQMSKGGKLKSDEDVVWSLYNELLTKTTDFHKLKNIYYQMAIFLNKKEKDFQYLLKLSNKMALLELKKFGVKKIEISTAGKGNSCSRCLRQKKKFSIEEALEQMPLPCKGCTTKVFTDKGQGFCRCLYVSAD